MRLNALFLAFLAVIDYAIALNEVWAKFICSGYAPALTVDPEGSTA